MRCNLNSGLTVRGLDRPTLAGLSNRRADAHYLGLRFGAPRLGSLQKHHGQDTQNDNQQGGT